MTNENVSMSLNASQSPRLLDVQFSEWVVQQFAHAMPEDLRASLKKLVQAVSYTVGLQHTCLNLQLIKNLELPVLNGLLAHISSDEIRQIAQYSIPVLYFSKDASIIWLQKYHYYEHESQSMLRQLVLKHYDLTPSITHQLDAFFTVPDNADNLMHQGAAEQKMAAKKALCSQLAVITGGPGTGKTYTVARIIALLLSQQENLSIVLAAPTGKAAQRMKESLTKAIRDDENFLASLPYIDAIVNSASTLHALLGIYPGKSSASYNRDNPLLLDVLIVDEASMIDLPMMHRLLQALPSHARLVLLGDKDQLASVEAGSVLAELSASKVLEPSLANITVSRRFGSKPEIGHLAQWLNGNAQFAMPDFYNNHYVRWIDTTTADVWQPLWLKPVLDYYRARQANIKNGVSIMSLLQTSGDFQILCGLNKGPFGVSGINQCIEQALQGGLSPWYAGKPVIILRNDKARQLYNGDVGMVLPVANDGLTIDINGDLKACFVTGDGIKVISRQQLPEYETCYAITVHKSQGSEYRHVVIVLPGDSNAVRENPVLSRELAYTAVTRAKESMDIYAGEGVLASMAMRKTYRMSGLARLLEETA